MDFRAASPILQLTTTNEPHLPSVAASARYWGGPSSTRQATFTQKDGEASNSLGWARNFKWFPMTVGSIIAIMIYIADVCSCWQLWGSNSWRANSRFPPRRKSGQRIRLKMMRLKTLNGISIWIGGKKMWYHNEIAPKNLSTEFSLSNCGYFTAYHSPNHHKLSHSFSFDFQLHPGLPRRPWTPCIPCICSMPCRHWTAAAVPAGDLSVFGCYRMVPVCLSNTHVFRTPAVLRIVQMFDGVFFMGWNRDLVGFSWCLFGYWWGFKSDFAVQVKAIALVPFLGGAPSLWRWGCFKVSSDPQKR